MPPCDPETPRAVRAGRGGRTNSDGVREPTTERWSIARRGGLQCLEDPVELLDGISAGEGGVDGEGLARVNSGLHE
jgi:hypothetical protein